MEGVTNMGTILRTKLHRPPSPRDYVHRPRLFEHLEQRRELPLILVSAPAGYGKSTLISDWAQSLDCPSAWISLDQYDNELGVFQFCGPMESYIDKTWVLNDLELLK